MADIQGMFGQDPALLQQLINQKQQESYTQNIASTPFGLGQQIGNQAGGMLGNALGAATGYVDPRIADAQLMQQVQQQAMQEAQATGINPATDYAGFGKIMANKYLQIGKPDKAFAVMQSVQGMQGKAAEAAKQTAEARKAGYIGVGDRVFDISKGAFVDSVGGAQQGKSAEERYINGLVEYRNKKDNGIPTTPQEDAWAQAAWTNVSTKVAQSGEVADLSSYLSKLNPTVSGGAPQKGTPTTSQQEIQPAYTPVRKSETTIRKDVESLGKDINALALPELDTYSESIQTMMDKYVGKELPGVGGVNNIPIAGPAYNAMIRSLGPQDRKQFADDALDMRRSVDGWKAGLIRLSAGLSQTNTEVANQVKKLALSPINDSNDFRRAFDEVSKIIGAQKQNLVGKYGKDTINYYTQQRQDKKNIFAPSQQQIPQQVQSGSDNIQAKREFLKAKGY